MNPMVLQALEQGACVITATQRLSYEVKSAYEAWQVNQQKEVWQTAGIFSWEGWMQSLWHDISACSAQSCLSNLQLKQLMIEIIEADLNDKLAKDDRGVTALRNTDATATAALTAWQTCHQWRISYSALKSSAHDDHARFGQWAMKLHARLRQQGWISQVEIADFIIASKLTPKQDAVLLGFDHLDTQQQAFVEFYRARNRSLKHINSDTKAATHLNRYEFESPRGEWQAIGAWAREKLFENPQFKIAIVTPDTENIRRLAQQSLREQLIPAYFELEAPDPFHFSVGRPISEVPIVNSALACLTLAGDIEFGQLTAIFLSSYWGGEAEQDLRAQLMIDLRRRMAYRFDLREFIEELSLTVNRMEQPSPLVQSLLEKLNKLQLIQTDNRGVQSLSGWRNVFKLYLETLGWPISRLDSDEFQALQAWEHCLEEWAKLDSVCRPMSFAQALHSLNSICKETSFQPQAQANAPIQVLGVLEVAELNFDAVWLAGFDEQHWPVIKQPNPFLPISSQIQAGVPEAKISLQTEMAVEKTTQLCALCDEVNVSHAVVHDDIKLRISPIFPNIDCAEIAGLPTVFSLDHAIRAATPALQSRSDDVGHPYTESTARGGTGLIQKQAACPFSAYAHHRLRAGEEDEPTIGMDNFERGNLLHKSLEVIWLELKNSKTLLQHIANGTLNELIHRHTRTQIKRYGRRSGLGAGFLSAELNRLNLLIEEWLHLEARRPAFQVEATEQEIEYQIGDLTLSFTLDRVDQLIAQAENTASPVSRLIMDYKIGNCELKGWVGKRLDQPQIPLYYLALDDKPALPIDALTYAQVLPGECEFVGISRQKDRLPGVKNLEALTGNNLLRKDFTDWSDLKTKWQARIHRLLGDYQQGIAHVDPKSGYSCEYCTFTPLCRIHTLGPGDSEDDNGTD